MESKVALMLRAPMSSTIGWNGKTSKVRRWSSRSPITRTLRRISLFDSQANTDSPVSFSDASNFRCKRRTRSSRSSPSLAPLHMLSSLQMRVLPRMCGSVEPRQKAPSWNWRLLCRGSLCPGRRCISLHKTCPLTRNPILQPYPHPFLLHPLRKQPWLPLLINRKMHIARPVLQLLQDLPCRLLSGRRRRGGWWVSHDRVGWTMMKNGIMSSKLVGLIGLWSFTFTWRASSW